MSLAATAVTNREVVPAHIVENFIVGGVQAPYRESFRARSREFNTGPGDGVYFPSTSPHMTNTDTSWVAPGNGVSVSLGVNFYTPSRVTSAAPAGRAVGQDASAYPYAPPHGYAPREPRTAMGWEVRPESLEELLVGLSRRAPDLPLRVTENGAAYDDERRAPDGSVDDPDRIAYYPPHLAALDRARAAGADVRTYVAWTLLDNFEWAEGYTKKFGLVEVEAGTMRRIPKASYRWFDEHVRRAGVATG